MSADSPAILLGQDAPAILLDQDSSPLLLDQDSPAILLINFTSATQRIYITVDGIQLTVDGQPVWILQ